MRKLTLAFLFLFCVPMAAFAGRLAPLEEIDVEANPRLTTGEIGKAVKQALIGRRWQIAKETGNSLEALQSSRGLMAKIKVTWDSKRVRSQYLDSSGFDYTTESGQPMIHNKYNQWIGNLNKDIPVFMERIAFTK